VNRLRAVRRIALFLVLAACGSRTGLFADDALTSPPQDDGPTEDAAADASSGFDVRVPDDVDRRGCPDGEPLLVYTVGTDRTLRSFNPRTGRFRKIRTLECPTRERDDSPFSMAVDRQGVAYVLFRRSEQLFRVSTATGACTETPARYVPRQFGFGLFGMGFATNAGGPTETLYVAGEGTQGGGTATGLGRINTSTFTLTPIGEFSPAIRQAELTGTGFDRLFAFYKKQPGSTTSYIGEIDPQTARVSRERRFDRVDQGFGWAFAYWGGDFYMFYAPQASTLVKRWRPSDDSTADVPTSTDPAGDDVGIIVGAGVSTCAPQQ
jgi:hypothetical protein